MKKVLKKNIFNRKEEKDFNWKRVFAGLILLLFIIFIITFINGAIVDKSI